VGKRKGRKGGEEERTEGLSVITCGEALNLEVG
jgi:hypothetical protein